MPIGVSDEPILAAIVIRTTKNALQLSMPHTESIVNAMGMMAISDTSFVTNIAKKKHANTKKEASARKVFNCPAMARDMYLSAPPRSIPFTEVIRQNKHASVLKSI